MSQAQVIKPQDLMGDPERLFFNGDGLVKIFFKTSRLTMAQFALLPGQCLEEDVHPRGDEGYYVKEGVCTVVLPETGEIHEIHQGEIYLIPCNVRHRASNQHDKRLVVIAAIAPHA